MAECEEGGMSGKCLEGREQGREREEGGEEKDSVRKEA